MNGSPQRKDIRSSGGETSSASMQLMREIGSTKGWDPIPPDQYLTYQDRRYSPAQRLWAWLLSKTIRHGHRARYAIDEHGRDLTIKNASSELDMDGGNVRRAWRELEAEGRVHTEGRRLCLNGAVSLGPELAKEKRSEVCTDLFPLYLLAQIKRLPQDRRTALVEQYRAVATAEAEVAADVIAGVRSIFDQEKDTLLAQFGVKKIREEKRRKEEPRSLPMVREFLQRRSVQTLASPPLLVCTNGKTASVQTSVSLCISETEEKSKAAAASLLGDGRQLEAQSTPAAAASSPSFPYPAALAKGREFFPTIDQPFILKLLQIAKVHRPAITDDELASCIVRKHGQKSEGLFIATVGPRAAALNEYESESSKDRTDLSAAGFDWLRAGKDAGR